MQETRFQSSFKPASDESHSPNTIYYAFIQPYIDYAIGVWGYSSMGNIDKIQRLQNRVARIFMNDFSYEHHSIDIIQTVLERRAFLQVFYCLNAYLI